MPPATKGSLHRLTREFEEWQNVRRAGIMLRVSRSASAPFTCPCCGHLVFDEAPGSYGICPVCFWEDDIVQLRWPDFGGGANGPSLIEAQLTYRRVGAVEERLLQHVRAAKPTEPIDPAWRPFDPATDEIEEDIAGTDYGKTYSDDPRAYYYWSRRTSSSDPAALSRAIVVWTGFGRAAIPARDPALLVAAFGAAAAVELHPIIERLQSDFYESDAYNTVAGLDEMGQKAADAFRVRHPDISDEAVEALAWCYKRDWK